MKVASCQPHLQLDYVGNRRSSRRIELFFEWMYITHRLVSVGSHWIKLTTSSDLITVVWFEGQETSKRSSLAFNQSWKTKECFLQKPLTGELRRWLTTPLKETRKNAQIHGNDLHAFPEGYKININKISQLPLKLRFSANCSFCRQSFNLGHYPPKYQLPKGVYLLIILAFIDAFILFEPQAPQAHNAIYISILLYASVS